jgi:hypothetical protein
VVLQDLLQSGVVGDRWQRRHSAVLYTTFGAVERGC